jgi:hypothetical protein
MRKIKQGDCDWADIPRTDGLILSADWVGKWAIVPAIGSTATVSGTMELSTDLFYFQRRITPTDTLACPVGSYILVTQISNATLAFSSEISQQKIAIVAQGIV